MKRGRWWCVTVEAEQGVGGAPVVLGPYRSERRAQQVRDALGDEALAAVAEMRATVDDTAS